MTDAFWSQSTDPLELLAALHPARAPDSEVPQMRKSRMYLIACARRQWELLPAACRALVELAELFADAPEDKSLHGAASPVAERLMNSPGEPDDLLEARAELAGLELPGPAAEVLAKLRAESAPPPLTPKEWRGLAALVYLPFDPYTPIYKWVPREFHSRERLKEVYGPDPRRRHEFDDRWRTENVVLMARGMYDMQNFEWMPIFADALQEAGCGNEDILSHCRDAGVHHVRGCWVLDLVLRRG